MSQSISLYKLLANHKLFNKTINFDLKRIKLVLSKLNHPEKKLKNVINFLGSSGKFTTLYSLKCFIEANNQSSTAYISPSLKDIKERGHLEVSAQLLRDILERLPIVQNVTPDTIEFKGNIPDDMDQDSIEDMGAKVSSMADQEAMKGVKAEL